MFWVSGDALAAVLRDILTRLVGKATAATLDVAAGAVRGVAYGVVGTAAIQAVVMAAGLAVAGVPGAALLGFVTLLLALSQIVARIVVLVRSRGLAGRPDSRLGHLHVRRVPSSSVMDNFSSLLTRSVGDADA